MIVVSESAPLNLFEKEIAPLIYHVYSKRKKLSAPWTRENQIGKKTPVPSTRGVLFTTKKEVTLIEQVILFEKHNTWRFANRQAGYDFHDY